MSGRFELHKSTNGQYYFVLKSEGDHVLLRSEQYKSKSSAQKGICSVQANCTDDAHYDKKESSDNKWYFNLKAGNQQVIGTSKMYPSAKSRDDDIAIVKINGISTTIIDIEWIYPVTTLYSWQDLSAEDVVRDRNFATGSAVLTAVWCAILYVMNAVLKGNPAVKKYRHRFWCAREQ